MSISPPSRPSDVVVPGPRTARLPLDPTPTTPADVRGWTDLVMRRFGVQSMLTRDDVALVVSELVSNALRHGTAPITLALAVAGSQIVVTVADAGPPPHAFDSPPFDPTAPHGRGLAIVAALTSSWGITPQTPGPGKAVWCLLDDTSIAPHPTPTAATR